MTDNQLIPRAEDLHSRAMDRGMVTHTGFLTPAEQYTLNNISQFQPSLIFAGGGIDCERQAAFFLPEYLAPEDFEPQQYLTAFHLLARFSQPGHRDILGSILGLGVERWCVGDILIQGEEAWFFCLISVAEHIGLNLNKVGRGGVKVTEIPLSQVPSIGKKREALSFTAASLRLDALIAGTFSISRSQAEDKISAGMVQLNYALCQKPGASVSPGDVYSLRGKGKACLTSAEGQTKKGRTRVNVERYL